MATEAGPTGKQKRIRDKQKKLLLKDRKLQLKNVFVMTTQEGELWHRWRGGFVWVHKACSRFDSPDSHLYGIGFKTA